jgi:ABC-type lipoprotein release transport system permease subunit
MVFLIFAPIVLALVVLVAVSAVASVIALVVAALPVKKVPLSYNLRNLQVRWLTTLVTGLAFTFVVGLLVVMLAFVQGMNDLSENSGNPANIIILADGATDEAFSSLPPGASVERLPQQVQNMIARDADGEYLAVKEVYVIVNHQLPNPEPGGRKRRFVQMRGIDKPLVAAKIHGVKLAHGEWFSPSGVREIPGTKETAYEVVIGDGIAKVFGQDKGLPAVGPGEILEIGPRKWYVVGVMDPGGSTFGSEIWALDKYVGDNFGRKNSYSSYVVRVTDPDLAAEAAKLLREFRSEIALAATPEREYYSKLNATNQQFLYAIIFVAVIMAIGGVLGVMNTMFAAISQRRKDIGVLRLLGFTRWQILMSFLMESLVIAFLGGALGCALGYLCDGWTASSILSSGQGGGGKSVVLRLTVTGWILGAAMIFTFLMGAVGGLIPSLSAMRLRPLESVR